eukprot:SAG31_NODE_8207_length_1496_cov_1.983536_2_plen_166_part_00
MPDKVKQKILPRQKMVKQKIFELGKRLSAADVADAIAAYDANEVASVAAQVADVMAAWDASWPADEVTKEVDTTRNIAKHVQSNLPDHELDSTNSNRVKQKLDGLNLDSDNSMNNSTASAPSTNSGMIDERVLSAAEFDSRRDVSSVETTVLPQTLDHSLSLLQP